MKSDSVHFANSVMLLLAASCDSCVGVFICRALTSRGLGSLWFLSRRALCIMYLWPVLEGEAGVGGGVVALEYSWLLPLICNESFFDYFLYHLMQVLI